MASMPKFEQIAIDLRAKIDSGEFAPGHAFPSDREIRELYGVASVTARKALAELRSAGLIEVRQGSSPIVSSWRPILRDTTTRLSTQLWGSGHAIWDADVADRALSVEQISVGETSTPPPWVAEALGTNEVLVRDRLFVVDGRPVQFALSYLPAEIARGTAIERHDTGPGGTFARLQELGFAPELFQERTRARKVQPEEARRLRMPADRTVLIIRRRAATASRRVVEVTEMTLDATAYVLQTSFTA